MVVVYYPLGAFSNYLNIYLPAFAITSGVDQTDAAFLMTIAGVMDLVTRIVSGYIADFDFVAKHKVVYTL